MSLLHLIIIAVILVSAYSKSSVSAAPRVSAYSKSSVSAAPRVSAYSKSSVSAAPRVSAYSKSSVSAAPRVSAYSKSSVSAAPRVSAYSKSSVSAAPRVSAYSKSSVSAAPRVSAYSKSSVSAVPSVSANSKISVSAVPKESACSKSSASTAPKKPIYSKPSESPVPEKSKFSKSIEPALISTSCSTPGPKENIIYEITSNSTKRYVPHVSLRTPLNNRSLTFLVDTGSAVSLIKSNAIKSMPVLQNEIIHLKGIDNTNETIPTSGHFQLQLFPNSEITYRFHVVEQIVLNYDGIIGTDLLNDLEGIIDYNSDTLQIGNIITKLNYCQPIYEIAPRTETIIECTVNKLEHRQGLILDQHVSDTLLIANCIVAVKDNNRINISVVNTSEKTVTISSDLKLEIQPLEEYYDAHSRPVRYKVGDYVYLKNHVRLRKALSPVWKGPYKVVKINGRNTLTLLINRRHVTHHYDEVKLAPRSIT
ncbi:hypothetical protein HF086_003300 [Spodoptera exigua]|uniref:Retropepsins domain-containing protein n=1 Tax=Spodoptera exigua TaxID=7107 RepID=A0A922MZ37_SPOEX|nr:hypothetical protein HF086_003300 [Spodoptera exigua]